MFNTEKVTAEVIQWIKDWFEENGKNCNAVLGISGGKDSSIVAALCVKALGKDRVYGILMPNGVQSDIDDSLKQLGLSYIDLCLLHQHGSASGDDAVYKAMIRAVKDGKIRSIGISNFYTEKLFRIS